MNRTWCPCSFKIFHVSCNRCFTAPWLLLINTEFRGVRNSFNQTVHSEFVAMEFAFHTSLTNQWLCYWCKYADTCKCTQLINLLCKIVLKYKA